MDAATGVFGMASTASTMSAAVMAIPMNTPVEAKATVPGSCSLPPWAAITPLATAPKIAAPTALPIERANMLAPVTTPRSPQPTLDWAAIRVGTADQPNPNPITKHDMATTISDGESPKTASAMVPATTNAVADHRREPEPDPQVEPPGEGR